MQLNPVPGYKSAGRYIYLLLLLTTLFVITISFYIEYGLGIKSCPLCFMQRLCAVLYGLFCTIALFCRRCTLSMLILQAVAACGGLFFSARQVWLQLQPADMGGMCMPGLGHLIDSMSWNTVIKSFVWGTTNCSEVVWSCFGLPIPVWSSVYFSLMIIGTLFIYFYSRRGHH